MAKDNKSKEEKFRELYKTDPDRAEAIRALSKEQPNNSWENLFAQTEDDYIEKAKLRSKDRSTFLSDLFGKDEDKFLDDSSEFYFFNLPFENRVEIAESSGAVNPLPPEPTEEDKQKHRAEMSDFLNHISQKATDYNAAKVWNKKDPNQNAYGDFQDWLLDTFYAPFKQRMKEKGVRREGPSGWTDFGNMDAGDVAAFGTDYMKNVLLGLTPGAYAKGGAGVLEGMGIGAAAGLADASNRDLNTMDEQDYIDYLTKAGYGAGAGVITRNVAPAVLKGIGDAIKRLGGGTKQNLMKRTGELLEDVSLAAAGQKVNLSKYGKEADVAEQVIMSVLPVVERTAPVAVYSGAKVPMVNIRYGAPVEISVSDAAKDLKRRKPEAWRRADLFMSDYGIKDPFTPEELAIYNAYRKELFGSDLGEEGKQ